MQAPEQKAPPMLNDLPEEEQQRLLRANEAEFENTLKAEEIQASVGEIEKSQEELDNDVRRLENAKKMKDMDNFTLSRKQAKRMGIIVPNLPERIRQNKLTKSRNRKADKLARKQRRINRLTA